MSAAGVKAVAWGDWEQHTDDATAAPYYHHAASGTTSWEFPAHDIAPAATTLFSGLATAPADAAADADADAAWTAFCGGGGPGAAAAAAKTAPAPVPAPQFKADFGGGGGPGADDDEEPKKDYAQMARDYIHQKKYRDHAAQHRCVLCRAAECEDVLFPCEHKCICRGCQREHGIGDGRLGKGSKTGETWPCVTAPPLPLLQPPPH